MIDFNTYLTEANSAGAEFEQKTADMLNRFLKKNGLGGKFRAKRYQTVSENAGRDEDYSDVVVENIKTGERFFVECKEFDRSNVLNMQFDISEDFKLRPVKEKSRKPLDEAESEIARPFIDSLANSDGYKNFVKFLRSRNRRLSNSETPSDFYFGKSKRANDYLPKLIDEYNKLVESGKTEADCKKFDKCKLRDSTKNTLVCALCWRLARPENGTWDICQIDGIPGLSRLIRSHYEDGKRESAKYIQFGDKLFRLGEDNPLDLDDIPVFPDSVDGKFTLKFTPRFGTGSIYITPRSEITSELESDVSFIDEDKWPSIRRQIDESANVGEKRMAGHRTYMSNASPARQYAGDAWFLDYIDPAIDTIVDFGGCEFCDYLNDKTGRFNFIVIDGKPESRRRALTSGYDAFDDFNALLKYGKFNPMKSLLVLSQPICEICPDKASLDCMLQCNFRQIAVNGMDIDRNIYGTAPIRAIKWICENIFESPNVYIENRPLCELYREFQENNGEVYNKTSDRINIKNLIQFVVGYRRAEQPIFLASPNEFARTLRSNGYAFKHRENSELDGYMATAIEDLGLAGSDAYGYKKEFSNWLKSADIRVKWILEK